MGMNERKPARPKPKLKYTRQAEVIVQREPAPKLRLTRDDVFRSPNRRGYDER